MATGDKLVTLDGLKASHDFLAKTQMQTGLMQIPFAHVGYYIITNTNPVSLTPVASTQYFDCTTVPCAPGDKFTVSGSGNARSSVWTFLDSNNAVLTQEAELSINDKIITAPANAVLLVLNNRKYETPDAVSWYGSWRQEINNEFASVHTEISQIPSGHLGKNKFYNITMQDGYLQSATNIAANATYRTTDYIDVSEYENHVCISPRLRVWAEYTADKTPNTAAADSGYHNGTITNAVLTPHADTKYIRVSLWISDLDHVQLEDGTACTTYEAPQLVMDDIFALNDHQKAQVDAVAGNVLHGKKWAVCGDSFTAGADSGVLTEGMYAGQKIVYPYIIGGKNEMVICKFFENGRTLAFPADPDTFANSLTAPGQEYNYQNIPEDADYITIYLGINDRHHADGDGGGDDEDTTGVIPIGTITDSTTATHYGAWNVVLSWLIENRPFAHIGIIVTNGASAPYREAQIAVAKKYGIPYLDLNGDERTPCMIRSCNTDVAESVRTAITQKQAVSESNTHPNNAAHRYEATFIEHFLRSL